MARFSFPRRPVVLVRERCPRFLTLSGAWQAVASKAGRCPAQACPPGGLGAGEEPLFSKALGAGGCCAVGRAAAGSLPGRLRSAHAGPWAEAARPAAALQTRVMVAEVGFDWSLGLCCLCKEVHVRFPSASGAFSSLFPCVLLPLLRPQLLPRRLRLQCHPSSVWNSWVS